MKSIFSKIPISRPKRSTFDLTHDVKLSFKMGQLIPTTVLDVVPGDSFNISHQALIRTVPMVAPVMHKVNVTMHYFFVPNRLLWPQWQDWITGNVETQPPSAIISQNNSNKSLGAYFGMPSHNQLGGIPASAFPGAAYALIYDEYYRDQNLQETPLFQPLNFGLDNAWVSSLYDDPPRQRAWERDYFTSALPFAQKGDDVLIPLNRTTDLDPTIIRDAQGQQVDGNILFPENGKLIMGPEDIPVSIDNNANAETINTLRRAFKLQEWLEKNARGGTRYIESILSHFGVMSSDSRLQRPEYLGGHYGNVTISEVLSTAETDIPVGTMAGHGISANRSKNYSYTAEEHGWIIGILNVQPKTAYQQGLPKMYSRDDRFDYFWPSFANLGEQEIKNKEIYADQNIVDGLATFGYTPRYSEYKDCPSRVAGDLRDNLSFWHLGRIFSAPPVLNEDFILCEPSNRIFAVTDPEEDQLIAHVTNIIKATRPMPRFGVPTI